MEEFLGVNSSAAETDTDGDGVPDTYDATPSGGFVDTDGDGISDDLEALVAIKVPDRVDDFDGDGIPDSSDPFPFSKTPSVLASITQTSAITGTPSVTQFESLGSTFVAYDNANKTVWTSTDAQSWTELTNFPAGVTNIQSVSCNENLCMFGTGNSSNQVNVYTTTDFTSYAYPAGTHAGGSPITNSAVIEISSGVFLTLSEMFGGDHCQQSITLSVTSFTGNSFIAADAVTGSFGISTRTGGEIGRHVPSSCSSTNIKTASAVQTSVVTIGARAYTSGGKYINYSSDSGASFTEIDLSPTGANVIGNNNITGIAFKDETNGIAVTDAGEIVFTTNGGSVWNYLNTTGTSLLSVEWSEANSKYYAADSNGDIYTID